MRNFTKKPQFQYIPPKRISQNEDPAENKPHKRRFTDCSYVENAVKNISSEEKKTLEGEKQYFQTEKMLGIQPQVCQFKDPTYNEKGELNIVIKRVKKQQEKLPKQIIIFQN